MRMVDRRVEFDNPVTGRPAFGFAARLRGVVLRVSRAWAKRRLMRALNEMDDHQLLDIGLRRGDLRDVATSTFFSDAGLHLTIAARERARRHLRLGRTD